MSLGEDKRVLDIVDTTLKRDTWSKSLRETDINKADQYLERRRQMKERVDAREERLSVLESEMKEIKAALNILLERIPEQKKEISS